METQGPYQFRIRSSCGRNLLDYTSTFAVKLQNLDALFVAARTMERLRERVRFLRKKDRLELDLMFFKQIKYRGDNFSYIMADEDSHEAVVVDPSFNVDAIILVLKDKGFSLKYVVDTHGHQDHTAGNRDLKSAFKSKIVAHRLSHVGQDDSVDDGDSIRLGKTELKVIHTPGHTPDSICLLIDGKLLTGDTLFVGECGRTDLPGGSPKDMYASLRKIAELDDKIEVYPGHDYGSSPSSTLGIEKRTNYTLQNRTLEEFLVFMGTP